MSASTHRRKFHATAHRYRHDEWVLDILELPGATIRIQRLHEARPVAEAIIAESLGLKQGSFDVAVFHRCHTPGVH